MSSPSLIRTLGGDSGFGENVLDRNDDGSTPEIDLTSVFPNGLNFFGETYTSLWVNNNGSVTFEGSLGSYTPSTISSGTYAGIFPYWADVDTRNGEDLNTSPGGNSQGTNLVWYDLDEANGTFTVTWDDVGFFSRDNSRVNAFQLVLEDMSDEPGRDAGDFDIHFRYEWVDWTTGNYSGGTGGLGGTPARAGYSAGNDAGTFYELPQSGDEDALRALENSPGNTGLDGLWTFQVQGGDVPQTVTILSAGEVVEGDTGTTTMSFTVQRYGSTAGTLEVDWTAIGFAPAPADSADITGTLPAAGTVMFDEGETSQTITFEVTGDTLVEPDEWIIVNLGDATDSEGGEPVFASRSATGVILDDDMLTPPAAPEGPDADIHGDPHMVTLDGLAYDFQAVGEFVALESTDATNPLNVQIRTQPLSDVVSITTAVAIEVGSSTVTFDSGRADPLWIDGEPVQIDPVDGAADIAETGGAIYFDGYTYTVVMPNGEQFTVGISFGGTIQFSAYLSDSRDPESLRGLLGSADGDSSNDIALRDGTVLTQPVTFDTLYGTYADSWRISEAEALFDRAEGETTADWQDTSYPRTGLGTSDLPADLQAAAEAAVDAAGITDPVLREAAILDFALTGDLSFVTGATMVNSAIAGEAVPSDAPALGTTLLLSAPGTNPEGDTGLSSFQFTVDRFGDTSGELEVLYTVSGDVNGTDIGNGMSGSVTFADGETEQVITVQVRGDTTVETDEDLTVAISVADPTGITFAGDTATAVVQDDDAVPSIQGDEGDNLLEGDAGSNVILGLAGNDTMRGFGGDDQLLGSEGDDVLDGGAGADYIDGGLGWDIVSYESATRRVMVDLTTDAFDLGDAVGDVFANVEEFRTGMGPDQLRGDAEDNIFSTGGLSDRLYGRAGNDTLNGEDGADALYGGLGADEMTGGDQADRTDRFIYFNILESGVGAGNRDVITDFIAGEDRIEISRFDADTTQGFKQAFTFVGDAGLSGAAGELAYVQTGGNTIVQADTDGDGAADFEIELTGLIDLTAGDFLI